VASGRDCASLKCVVLYLSLSRGTGRRFLFARLPQAKRCGQGGGQTTLHKRTKRVINRLIGYGILVFLIGFYTRQFLTENLQWLIPIGTLMTFTGVFFFFKTTNLTDEFTKNKNDDILTYFWNVIALKFWTFILILWMITMNITLFTHGRM
jgi:hypothetical protein